MRSLLKGRVWLGTACCYTKRKRGRQCTFRCLQKSAVADWQRSYRRLFELAALKKPDGTLKRCFPHMFRDTFAVEMLLAGVPLEQVSILLVYKSVKITERHYAPWVK